MDSLHDWSPSYPARAHIAELPRRMRRSRDNTPESDLGTLLYLDQFWGVKHVDAMDRRGCATLENLERAFSLRERRFQKKTSFKVVRSSSVFYPVVERRAFTVRQYGGASAAKMKPILGWTMLLREDVGQAELTLANEEQETRDEVGFLLLQQGFADRFFPGTSVQHT